MSAPVSSAAPGRSITSAAFPAEIFSVRAFLFGPVPGLAPPLAVPSLAIFITSFPVRAYIPV